MVRKLPDFNLDNLVKTIVATILNVFDFISAIEGSTGISKSTLALHMARGIRREFMNLYELRPDTVEYYYERVMKQQGYTPEQFIELLLQWKKEKKYLFRPQRDLIYDHKSMKKGLNAWGRIMIPDEAILLSHNRDFQGEEQKKIIKLININRDHRNVVIMCIPNFNVLDIQIKMACKMRISVARRGIAIVHTPDKTFFGRDKWNSALNEKIEREYLAKNPNRPAYSKLTTARGIVKYKKLSPKVESMYQQIKNEKRGLITDEEKEMSKKSVDPIDKFVEKLVAGGIRNGQAIEGLAIALNLTSDTIRSRVQSKLDKMGKPKQVSSYYWDKKAKKEEQEAEKLVIPMIK